MKSFYTNCVKSLVFAAALEALAFPAIAANPPRYITLQGRYCCWDGKAVTSYYEFDSLEGAKRWVEKICRFSGLQANFELRAANVPTAMAVMEGNKRWILYNPKFMRDLDTATTTWGSVSVLAHEIAHHLHNDILEAGGSRHELELLADYYSGYVLKKLGASLDEACAAVKTLREEATSTHPGRSARETAIATGWLAAEEQEKEAKDIAATKPDEKPKEQTVFEEPDLASGEQTAQQPTVPTTGDQARTTVPVPPTTPVQQTPIVQPKLIARIVAVDDHRTFLVTATNQVIVIDPLSGQGSVYGMREAPRDPSRFAWDVVRYGDYERFGVTYEGRLIKFVGPFQQPIDIGYVTGLEQQAVLIHNAQ